MINGIYSIYDKVAQEFGPVFEAKNDDVAERNHINAISNVVYKDDFELYCVGSIDHETGLIRAKDSPEKIVLVSNTLNEGVEI